MTTKWVPAHGEHQLAFLGAASRALHGDSRPCPKCSVSLRAYFHVINVEKRTGSLWAWCSTCGMFATLPRVKPTVCLPDPFSDLSREEFIALELSTEELFFDRLERMWNDGALCSSLP